MNEQYIPNLGQNEQHSFAPDRRHEPRPVQESGTPDWRRFEVAAHRFGELIAAGITSAMEKKSNIDQGTARCIAHVLGRSLGRDSALANFGRTGEGEYEPLREEYLTLHNDHGVSASTQELIDWLGTHLIQQKYPEARSAHYVEIYPPRLDNVLVLTGVKVGDRHLIVQVPGIYNSTDITELAQTLTELAADKDAALRAFLGLPDVNAMSGDIMEDFHQQYVGTYMSVEDAIHELAEVKERERDVFTYAEDRQLVIEQMNPDYQALRDEMADGFDFVEEEGRIYVFQK